MMKRLLLLMVFASFFVFEAASQCGRISLIGEFTNNWTEDHFMTRNPEMPNEFSTIITVKESDDIDLNGFIDMKFRENADWTNNWGSADFPSGTGVPGGDNIPVPAGSYLVTFNCETLVYNFQSTCGAISLIGEFTNNWSEDHFMTRDVTNPDMWTTYITVKESDDIDLSGFIDMKFRENANWDVNWGSTDFPSGTGVQGGDNIPVPAGSYKVTFNCSTAEYNFVATCGDISLIGEFTNNWSEDHYMMRDATNPNMWHTVISITAEDDLDENGTVDMKFRENGDWTVNWGSADFPSGTGTQGGDNIPAALEDPAVGLYTDYYVTFNCSTGEYNFVATSSQMNLIGEFNGWANDVPMYRDATDPNLWKLTWALPASMDVSPVDGKIEVKFRETNDWTANWGGDTFPTGTGVSGGNNIYADPGTYDITFNYSTLEYTFTSNTEVCGNIGIIGEFNSYGGDPGSAPTDLWMVRDQMYPSNFRLEYNFTSSDLIWFRLNGDPLYNDIWGGTTFPAGTGVQGGDYIQVPGGKYVITYNCLSHDYNFQRLGLGVTAPKVFSITVDGNLDEADWDISQPIAKLVEGTVPEGNTMIDGYFGVAYNDDYLYVGIRVTDSNLTALEEGHLFLDGDKSGGPYDAHDLYMVFGAMYGGSNYYEVIHGPEGITPMLAFVPATDFLSYTAEVAIPWAALDVTPTEGAQAGFDIILGNSDSGTSIDYYLAWNGDLNDTISTSSFGDLNFGILSCGKISMYNGTIGDVLMWNPTDEPTTYVGSYEMFENQDVMFRKDKQSAVTWGDSGFPTGTATVGGPQIPATTGRYRIQFDCITGGYSFVTDTLSTDGIAMADYTTTAPAIDGDLSEFSLDYGCAKLSAGTGPNNNTVTWGALWDENNLYLGAHVVDAVVEGLGNPWDNDAIEFYIDGNHDRDGAYDSNFDTQLILDALNESTLWIKADGVQIQDYESNWTLTSDGYNVELRLAWADFQFLPGKGRSIGFSLGNNDSDNGVGRDYQTVWFGTGNNWSNTGDLGDLQLAGGPYYFGVKENEDYNAFVVLFPNPSRDNVYLRLISDVFRGNMTIYITDMSGRFVATQQVTSGNGNLVMMNAQQLSPGIYFVNIIDEDGNRAVKKLIIQ